MKRSIGGKSQIGGRQQEQASSSVSKQAQQGMTGKGSASRSAAQQQQLASGKSAQHGGIASRSAKHSSSSE